MTTESTTPRANSWDEWSRLREVVVGRGEGFTAHELDTSFRLFYWDNIQPVMQDATDDVQSLPISEVFVEELLEDLEGFVQALEGAGVKVHRPVELPTKAMSVSPWWEANAIPALNVRDQTIVLGDTIVETAPHVRSRYFENDLLKPIFYRYFGAGSPWVSMPKPALAHGALDIEYFDKNGIDVGDVVQDDVAGHVDGLGLELIFDGAQCMRFGQDVMVNVANENHRMAYRWLEQQFDGKFRFHLLDGMADSHIDSIVVPLRPGLLMLRSDKFAQFLPKQLQEWDRIYPEDIDDWRFPSYEEFGINLASRYIDINVLSIDENTVVVNSLCPTLIRTLENKGFDVIPVQHRHRRLFSGGFHCFTLDTVRDGGRENYFDG